MSIIVAVAHICILSSKKIINVQSSDIYIDALSSDYDVLKIQKKLYTFSDRERENRDDEKKCYINCRNDKMIRYPVSNLHAYQQWLECHLSNYKRCNDELWKKKTNKM